MTLFIAPIGSDWPEFCSWFPEQHKPRPTELGVWVYEHRPPDLDGTVLDELIAGSCLYQAGPYLLVEFFAMNPHEPLRLRHRATMLGLGAIRTVGAAMNLTPMCLVHHAGLAKCLERAGWNQDKSGAWICPRWALLPGAVSERVKRHPSVALTALTAVVQTDVAIPDEAVTIELAAERADARTADER